MMGAGEGESTLAATLRMALDDNAKLRNEVQRLNSMRTHCVDCGADYMATGVETGCPCKLHKELDRLRSMIGAGNAAAYEEHMETVQQLISYTRHKEGCPRAGQLVEPPMKYCECGLDELANCLR